jgi:hypothetical protein
LLYILLIFSIEYMVETFFYRKFYLPPLQLYFHFYISSELPILLSNIKIIIIIFCFHFFSNFRKFSDTLKKKEKLSFGKIYRKIFSKLSGVENIDFYQNSCKQLFRFVYMLNIVTTPIVCPNQDDICFLIMLESHFTKYLNHENYSITIVTNYSH